jgi:asparagine synthase (glutamine-hydrolysing)
MSPGFSVLCRDGGVEFRLPACRHDGHPPLVSFHREGELAAALLGRLYYRQDLLARVGPAAVPANAGDAALALAAYRQLGEEGLAALEGDFAAVVWDGRQDRLLGARDPLGGYPLYWTHHGDTLALGTAARPLADLLPRRSLDPEYAADLLTLPSSFYHEVPSERCAFEGVRRLGAGCLLRADVRSGAVTTRACWDWLRNTGKGAVRGPEDAAARLGELLRGAVRERLRGVTACHLSGGMDSTSVALLARDEVAAGRGRGPLHALSLVYDDLALLARETPYLESVGREPAGLTMHRLRGDDLLDFDGFREPPPHDEPWPWLYRAPLERGLAEAAARAGAATVLTGIGGDEVLEAPPYHLAGLLRRGRLLAAWREASRWARARTCSVWKILGPCGLAGLLPAWTRAGLRALFRGGYASWRQQNDYTLAPWIRPEFSRRHGLRGRALDHARRTYSSGPDTATSMMLAALAARTGDQSRWHLAAPRGLHAAHPFLDPRVVTFCLGLPTALKAHPERAKPLLAEALCGVLPERIRTRLRKGHFNEVYYRGLSRNLPRLEALVREAPGEELGLFDREALLECLRQAAVGVGRDFRSTDRLNISLALLQWLSLEARGPASPAAAAEVVRIPRAGVSAAPCGLS